MLPCPYPNFTSDQVKAYTELHSYLYCEGLCKLSIFLNQYLISDLTGMVTSYLRDSDIAYRNDPICLQGSAGTGKTYLTCVILKELSCHPENNVYVLAPTHKARQNLSRAFHKEDHVVRNVFFLTLASFLKMTLEYEPSGNSYFVSKLTSNDLEKMKPTHIFIDEVSMIKKNEWADIKTYILGKLPQCKVILVGDDHQLPPVMEEKSVVFEEVKNKLILEEIIRTEKNDLLKFYRGLRMYVDGNQATFPFSVYRSKEVVFLPEFPVSILKMSFDPKQDKIIAYRNKTVDNYTQVMRKILYGDTKEEFVEGEQVMFQHYYVSSSKVPFYPSYEFTIDRVRIVFKKIGGKECKLYEITHQDHVFYKIHPEHREVFEAYFLNLKMSLKRKSVKMNRKDISEMWKDYYQKKNALDVPITYAYALTVHKSQGSTYRKVFLDGKDLECLKYIDEQQYKHALYTAGTRASERVVCKT